MARTRAQTAADKARLRGTQLRKDGSRKRATRRAEADGPHSTAPSPPRACLESQDPKRLPAPVQSRGRKRKQPAQHALEAGPDPKPDTGRTPDADPKQQQTSPLHKLANPVAFWVEERRWPANNSWLDFSGQKTSWTSTTRDLSTTPSDEMTREKKNAPYRDPQYEHELAAKGSYMHTSELGITDTSKHLVRDLLGGEQPVPKGTVFDDDVFADTCLLLRNENEAKVILLILGLIVPSAGSLALWNKNYKGLVDSCNKGWSSSIPFVGARPQPDYSVGFGPNAFAKDQLAKLSPFVVDLNLGNKSPFMATPNICFPFLTCEVKCAASPLVIADRQNAHSMALAVRGIVELFRAIEREDEVNREILAFSVSHDHQSVRIYGHYPVITGTNIEYYRHPIRLFDLTDLGGKEKWTAYRFTRNVYDMWMPKHFEKICSAIGELPDLNIS